VPIKIRTPIRCFKLAQGALELGVRIPLVLEKDWVRTAWREEKHPQVLVIAWFKLYIVAEKVRGAKDNIAGNVGLFAKGSEYAVVHSDTKLDSFGDQCKQAHTANPCQLFSKLVGDVLWIDVGRERLGELLQLVLNALNDDVLDEISANRVNVRLEPLVMDLLAIGRGKNMHLFIKRVEVVVMPRRFVKERRLVPCVFVDAKHVGSFDQRQILGILIKLSLDPTIDILGALDVPVHPGDRDGATKMPVPILGPRNVVSLYLVGRHGKILGRQWRQACLAPLGLDDEHVFQQTRNGLDAPDHGSEHERGQV
jgi:hypothetical protein